MKKTISIMLTICLLLVLLSGCGAAQKDSDKPTVLVTIWPVYDWVKNMLGERAEDFELKLLLDEGVDMHSFQPSVQDMVAVADCDLLIYVGGESDKWIDEVEPNNPKQQRVSLLALLGEAALDEELAEGMQGEADDAPDEHVWLSPKRARILCAALLPYLRALDEGQSRYLDAAWSIYDANLAALDADYEAAAASAAGDTLLFADRFPFRYLTEDYGLSYSAAFPGCEAETEASFQTVSFLAGKLDELGLKTVLVIESGDGRLAETVIAASRDRDQTVRVLNSMQGDGGGQDYLTVMRENLKVLKEALG